MCLTKDKRPKKIYACTLTAKSNTYIPIIFGFSCVKTSLPFTYSEAHTKTSLPSSMLEVPLVTSNNMYSFHRWVRKINYICIFHFTLYAKIIQNFRTYEHDHIWLQWHETDTFSHWQTNFCSFPNYTQKIIQYSIYFHRSTKYFEPFSVVYFNIQSAPNNVAKFDCVYNKFIYLFRDKNTPIWLITTVSTTLSFPVVWQ